jgi:hypothetical protein
MQPDGLAEGAKIEPVDPGEGKSWDETFRKELDRVRMNERKHVRG